MLPRAEPSVLRKAGPEPVARCTKRRVHLWNREGRTPRARGRLREGAGVTRAQPALPEGLRGGLSSHWPNTGQLEHEKRTVTERNTEPWNPRA